MNKDQSNKFLFDPDKVNEALKSAKHMDDLFAEGGALQLMLKNSMETILKAELEDHLGYPHRDSKNKNTSNSRNGSYKKSVKTTTGNLDLDIPRDRDGTFEPKAVPKHEGVSSKLEEQIISMYAKGMTTRDIESHVKEIYFGLKISPTAISSITEKILDHTKEWQSLFLTSGVKNTLSSSIHGEITGRRFPATSSTHHPSGISYTQRTLWKISIAK